jgi:hypothetical protein
MDLQDKVKQSFRTILMACGYYRIPGIEFNERVSPAINDFSFQIMLIAKLIWDLKDSIVDVETEFYIVKYFAIVI